MVPMFFFSMSQPATLFLCVSSFLVSKETVGPATQWCFSSLLSFQVIVWKSVWRLSRNRMFLSPISCLSHAEIHVSVFQDAEVVSCNLSPA